MILYMRIRCFAIPTFILILDEVAISCCRGGLILAYLHASQDKEDDLKVGVKSTALRFGDLTKYWISGFGAACVGSLALSGYNADLGWCLVWCLSEEWYCFYLILTPDLKSCWTGWPYYPFIAAAAAQLAWQVSTVDLSSRSDCNKKYVLSTIYWYYNVCHVMWLLMLQSYDESLNSLSWCPAGSCPTSGLELWYLVGFYLGVLYHDG